MRIGAPLDRYDAWQLVAATVYLYTSLFASPFTPYHLGGDQVFFWMDGLRLLHCEAVYRDFFQFTPPGTDFVYFGAFKLFGARLWVPNLVVLSLGIALSFVCLKMARQIMSRSNAALSLALYLVVVIGLTLDGTHHWFSLLLVMIAVVVVLRDRTLSWTLIAGSLLGAATFFTQTRGPAAALAISVWIIWWGARTGQHSRERLTRVACLISSLLVTWCLLSSHYLIALGPKSLWSFQVTYLHTYKVAGWNALSIGFPDHWSKGTPLYLARWIFAYLILPLALAIAMWRCARVAHGAASEHLAPVVLLVLVGGVLFAEVAVSPSWFRIFCVSLPAVILVPWLLQGSRKHEVFIRRILWFGVAALTCLQIGYAHSTYSAVAQLPGGTLATTPAAAEKWTWIAAHTKPGEYLLHADWPEVYLLADLRNPIYLDVVHSEGASELGYLTRSLKQLEVKRVRYIVKSPGFPTPEFEEYLVKRYRLIRIFADRDEVWERKQDEEKTSTPTSAPRA